MPRHPVRKRLRLTDFDYASPGAYFITVCPLGAIVGGEMRLLTIGVVVHCVWLGIPRRFPNVEVDALVVLPDHVHGIVTLHGRGWPRSPMQL